MLKFTGHLKGLEVKYPRQLPAIMSRSNPEESYAQPPKQLKPLDHKFSHPDPLHGLQKHADPSSHQHSSTQNSKHFADVDFRPAGCIAEGAAAAFNRERNGFPERGFDSRNNNRDTFHHPYDNFK